MTDESANGTRISEEQRIAYSGALARWAGRCARHPWRVIGSWLVIFVSLIVLNVAFHGTLVNDFNIPGSDVQKATDLINAKFGGQKGSALRVVVAAPEGQSLNSAEAKAAIDKMLVASKQSQTSLDTVKSDVSAITSPLAPAGAHQLAKDGRIAYFDVQFDQTGFELPRSGVVSLEDQLRAIGAPAGLDVQFTGDAESAPPTQGLSDIIGLVAAFIILIVLFRALVPTVIPLLFAITAVITAFLLLYLAAAVWHFNTITEILVPMIGLGVGIDYTLFIVTRFRQLLHDGLAPHEAAAAAGATAARAVIFAGVTVAISITGLAVIGIDFITKLGIGSALGVLTAVLLANSLLPAVLSLLGHKIDRGRLGMKPIDESREGQSRTWVAAWGRFVSRNAKIVLPVVIVVLCCWPRRCWPCAWAWPTPARRPRTRPRARPTTCCPRASAPASHRRSRWWWTCAVTTSRPRRSRPRWRRCPASRRSTSRSTTRRRRSRRRSRSSTPTRSTSRRTRRPTTSSRPSAAPPFPPRLAGSPARAYVSGENAAFTDIGNQILSRTPWFLLYIIGVTFLVLAMAFRSVVIAIKAALTTLVSALVGFGMLTLIVQLGHGMGFIGLDRTGPIESFVPPIAFAILFGLSMDYEVFLMSRIREEHVHGSDTVTAVKDGISGVGRVIVAAALIMSSVFFSFLLSPDRVSKEFGLLLGIAILTDALLMRMTLVPALLTVLGERSWAMPAWFDRILPNVTIESPGEREVPVVEREPVEVGAG